MAKKFLTSIDLGRNELQNAVLQVLGSAPSSPVPAQVYYNSTSGRVEFRSASGWIDPTNRAHHTGTQPASTISDFDTQVRTNRLDQLAAPTGPLSLNGQRITNLANPVNATDAATKGYVDAAVSGLDWKQSVRAATTANITLSGLQTVDGVSLQAGDRVLVKNQTSAAQNGIYVVSTGAWSRAPDADDNTKVTAGLAVMVTEGVVNANTQWMLATDDPISLGTSALVFTQIGASTSYTEGTGISISGNVISINTAVVARKFAQTIGNGSSSSITVTHGLGTQDVIVQVYEIATSETVECDVIRTSGTQVTLAFASPPANNSLRVVVYG